MIKNLTALEVKIGERIYKLLCEADSPLGEVHDVLMQMKAHVIKVMSDIQEKKPEDTQNCNNSDVTQECVSCPNKE